jgi:hypothetical protein
MDGEKKDPSTLEEGTTTDVYEHRGHKPLRDSHREVPKELTNEMGQNRQLFAENFLPWPDDN